MTLSPDFLASLEQTLLTGGYTLLLGAGASTDSLDRDKEPLPLGGELKAKLIRLKSIGASSTLARAYKQLTNDEINTHITTKFSFCTSGPTAQSLATFLWKRIYTLNVDDSIEDSYKKYDRMQKAISFTHSDPYQHPDDLTNIQIVHVHGWSQKPDAGYVFSLSEYAQGMGPGNAWVNVLAQTMTSEPFIVAGTSLEEPDLEYFMQGRNRETVRQDRGPSILIEPNPDAATEADCSRYGFHLYRGTLLDFLNEVSAAFPTRPLPPNANVGLAFDAFKKPPSNAELALFSKDFYYVVPKHVPENSDLSFYVGREPTFSDIALNRDVSRGSTNSLKSTLRGAHKSAKQRAAPFILMEDGPGSGKSTIARRALFDLSAEGVHVFEHKSNSSIDITLCAKLLNNFKYPFIIFCDNFADYATNIVELYKNVHRDDILVLGTDRSYRSDYVTRAIAGLPFTRVPTSPFINDEAKSLIVQMDRVGLTSSGFERTKIDQHAKEIVTDQIAVATCRIMNDFRPLGRIIESLVGDATETQIQRYAACALAAYCYRSGVYFSILTSSFESGGVRDQFSRQNVLPLTYSDLGRNDYVIPANPVLSQRILRYVADHDQELLFETYCSLGNGLSSYVNRNAIQKRTPEARIAGRLFDYDEVVEQFLGPNSEKFYIRMQKSWGWNSRYWEQFALLKLAKFRQSTATHRHDLLVQAISHARHAVQIEEHPFTLTTLGSILLEDMKSSPARRDQAFREAFDVTYKALRMEARMSRIAIHPYATLVSGSLSFLKIGGILNGKDRETLRRMADEVQVQFSHESNLLIDIANLAPHLK